MKRKKILFVNHEESRTGAPKVVFNIAKEIKKDHKVVMVSLKKGSMHKEFSREFKTVYPKMSGILVASRLMAKLVLLKQKPDLVYVNSLGSYNYAIEAKELGIPVIFHIHELKGGFESAFRLIESDNFNEWADVFIAVSDKVFDYLVKYKKCDPKKIKLINAFISSKEIIRKSKEILVKKLDKNKITLVSIGEVGKRKGTDIFIRTNNILKKKGYNFEFIWIGSSRYKEQILDDFVNKGDTVFSGEKRNPYPYLNLADIFLLTSREDPFPLVVMESMALGKPIIAFKDSGGMPKVIKNCCGLVVDEKSPEKLADAIIKLSKDKHLMRKFSKNAKKKQKEYDSEIIIPKIQNLVADVLKKTSLKNRKRKRVLKYSSQINSYFTFYLNRINPPNLLYFFVNKIDCLIGKIGILIHLISPPAYKKIKRIKRILKIK